MLNERLIENGKGNLNPHDILENSEEKVSHLKDLKETRTNDKVKIETNKANLAAEKAIEGEMRYTCLTVICVLNFSYLDLILANKP